MASVEVQQMLAAAVAACEDKKAEDIRILALDPAESGLTDFFLICTGTNDRQTVAITDEIEIRLKREFGTYPNAVEGRRQGDWVLMDYVDFIVHVFLPERRAFYGLERLRPSATTLSINDLNAEVKAAITSKRSGKSAPVKAVKTAAKKIAAKKTAAKKVAAKKLAAKGLAAKGTAAKSVTKTTAAKKTVVQKTSSDQSLGTKATAAGKVPAKKSPAKTARTQGAPRKTAGKAPAKRTR